MFHTSTQRAHWLFDSEASLAAHRETQHERQVERMNALKVLKPLGPLLSLEEERELVAFHCQQIQQLCAAFTPALPDRVIGTATAYLRRYYLANSVMGHPPSDVTHVCVFAACKTEEASISLAGLGSLLPQPDRAVAFIKEYELALLTELRFHLVVHNPFRPLRGLLADARQFVTGPAGAPVADEQWAQLAAEAREHLLQFALTDVQLLFPPSQLALTALLHACKTTGVHAEPYLSRLETAVASDGAAGGGRATQKTVDAFLQQARNVEQAFGSSLYSPFPPDRIKELQRKLSLCRDPFLDPASQE